MIVLCTDSSSLLPPSVAVDLGVGVAPVGVSLDGRSFEDGVDLDVDAFYAMLEQGVYLPPSAFEAWFVSAAHDHTAVERVTRALPRAAAAAAAATDDPVAR